MDNERSTERIVKAIVDPDRDPFPRPIGTSVSNITREFPCNTKLDFVHLSGITDGVNQALKKIRGDFNHLVFLVDL